MRPFAARIGLPRPALLAPAAAIMLGLLLAPVSNFLIAGRFAFTLGGGNFALGWKQSPRGSVDGARPDDSTPVFAEMANPGVAFEGEWSEKAFFLQPEIRRSVRWP